MPRRTIPIDSYREASQVFHWAKKRHYQLWFTGQTKTRHRRTETVLNKLVKYGELVEHWYQGVKNYTDKRPTSEIVHGLACTECLIRIYLSDRNSMVVAEKYFKKLGILPEWGIIFPNKPMLLFEFCTKSNYFHTGTMRGKLAAYKRNLSHLEETFVNKAQVLFVIDVPRDEVRKFVGNLKRDVGSVADVPSALSAGDTFPEPFYFTDYGSFLSVPLGEALRARIYFDMQGEETCLT